MTTQLSGNCHGQLIASSGTKNSTSSVANVLQSPVAIKKVPLVTPYLPFMQLGIFAWGGGGREWEVLMRMHMPLAEKVHFDPATPT